MVGAITATMVLGASAFWTTDTVTTNTVYTSGSADIQVYWSEDCSSPYALVADTTGGPATIPAGATDIPLGFSTTDCFRVKNVGDVALNLYVQNPSGSFGGSSALWNEMTVAIGGACTAYGPAAPNHPTYLAGAVLTSGLAAGAQIDCTVTTALPSTSSNQDSIQNASTNWSVLLWGQTN